MFREELSKHSGHGETNSIFRISANTPKEYNDIIVSSLQMCNANLSIVSMQYNLLEYVTNHGHNVYEHTAYM